MAVFFHHYTLHSRGPLNAVSQRREFHGALIKVDDGIGCLHPWPEFGDAPIDEQLQLLRDGGTSKVIERARHMAKADGAARRRGVSLFEGLEIPPSHYSWDQNQPMDAQMQRVMEEGWGAVKTKGRADVRDTLRWLDEFVAVAGSVSVKLRMDFNSCLTEAQCNELLTHMPGRVRALFDFIEDPFPYDAARWSDMRRSHRVRLALDKQLRGAKEGFDVAVIKPGRCEGREIVKTLPQHTRIVMTSAMDHAIGQSFAAYEAALAWKELGVRMDLCGLCTQHLFSEDDFFARMSAHGGNFAVDRSGTGLGFDEVIAKLPWQSL